MSHAKLAIKVVIYIVLITVGLFLILVGVDWYMFKQMLVRQGHAKPNFPYARYTQEELNVMYPQYPLENVKTTQTPEETYAKLIAALKAGDVDGAIQYFAEKKQQKFKEILDQAKRQNILNKTVKELDYPIKLKEQLDTFADYTLEDNSKNKTIIEFVKEMDGIWKINIL